MQILILGMHRSGTSAVARLINMMGAYFAPEGLALAPKNDNPKGFWERRDVLQLNEELLKLQECQWNQLAKWKFEDAGRIPAGLRQMMQILIMNMDGFRPWFLKDPRMCLTLPAWLPLLEVPLAVMVYRSPQEIALSLKNRNPISLEYALALWEYYTVGMLNATQQLPRVFVSHEDILSKPVKTCEAIVRQLNSYGARRLIMPIQQEVRAFIDPRLYRAKSPAADAALTLTAHQQELADLLQGKIKQTGPVTISPKSIALIQTLPSGTKH